MANIIDEIKLPEKIREQLKDLGIKEENIDNETAIIVSLYKQALKGKTEAIKTLKSMTEKEDDQKVESVDNSKLVAKEEKKIKRQLKGLTKKQLEINNELIHNIAFMAVTLKSLSQEIAQNGTREKYKNGANQWGYKETTAVKTYNNMFKNYQSAMKQLNELALDIILDSSDDDFEKFGDDE